VRENPASRPYIGNNPRLIEQYEAGHNRFIIDAGTPEELSSFSKRIKSGGKW